MAPKVLVPMGDGFEEIEAVAVIDILRRAGAEVTVASVTESRRLTGGRGVVLEADTLLASVKAGGFDAVVVPGGPGTAALRENGRLLGLLQEVDASGAVVAAICAAPTVLARAGLLEGRRAACYPSAEADMGGATVVHEEVVVDGNIVTSRGAGTAIAFALKLTELLISPEAARDVAAKIIWKAG